VETAWDWGATVGLSIAESDELGLAWVIREAELNLHRPLYPNDTFDLTIWLIDWRRVRGTRCFELRLKDGGELVAQGRQEVVSIDNKTLRPVATPEYIIDKLRMENPRVFEHRKFPKFHTRPEAAFATQRIVEWRDLDTLEHVNNANYASYAEDAAVRALASVGWSPAHFKTNGFMVLNKRFQVQYQSPAAWEESLDVFTYLTELKPSGGVWYVEIERTLDREPIVQCLLEWSLADRMSGEEQILPESLVQVLKGRAAVAEIHADRECG
jgi:YbgC/YbaW family acyl-CoA thioester hydrolase